MAAAKLNPVATATSAQVTKTFRIRIPILAFLSAYLELVLGMAKQAPNKWFDSIPLNPNNPTK
jgi:hypothetical protein